VDGRRVLPSVIRRHSLRKVLGIGSADFGAFHREAKGRFWPFADFRKVCNAVRHQACTAARLIIAEDGRVRRSDRGAEGFLG